MPIEQTVPLMVLLSVTVAALVLAEDWRHVHFHSASWLLLFTLLGIPCGLWLLTAAPPRLVTAILAAIIIAFSSYVLLVGHKLEMTTDRLAPGFGFIAGVLGGAYAMNGPPLVLYGTLRRWSPAHFRATLQGYLLVASLIALLGYALAGLWVSEVTWYYVISLPAALAAILLGRALSRRLDARRFVVCVHVLLIGLGVVLLVQSFAGAE